MATKEVNSQNLESLINDSNMLFIDFWAQWCGPCRMFGPTFEAASEKNADIVFAKCDTEAQQEVAAQFGIRSIPTLAVFKEGVMIFQQPGALPPAALDELIEKVKELDMEDVRKEMEKQKAAK